MNSYPLLLVRLRRVNTLSVKKKLLIYVCLWVLVWLGLPLQPAQAQKTYQIGTDVTYPPFEFAN